VSLQHEGRSPRLADIAEKAGVSKSLASLALRGERGVGEASRRRVLDAARDLGRQPSDHALRMLGGSSVVGVLVTDLRNPFHTEVVLGVERDAGGVSVLVANGGRDVDRMRSHLKDFQTLGVAGMVIVSSWLRAEDVAEAGRHTPVVTVGSTVLPVAGTDTVRGDVRLGVRQTVEHLVAAGHRRIGFVAESERSSSRLRHAAYLEQTSRFMQNDGTLSIHIDDLAQHPSRLTELVHRRRFTAFIAANDVTAIALMGIAARERVSVPGDVAIAGYDNTSSSWLVTPGLTSVDQPWEQMGARAFGMIRERALGRAFDRDEVMTPHLVTRGSTGAVPT
jgi:DNA-binding LacI/PurR family transcriptional regulator